MMKTRQASTRLAGITALAATAFLLPACGLEQVELGRDYILYTPRQGDCPVLEWRFVVDPQRMIHGSLVQYGGAEPADLSGTLNPDDTYRMTATAMHGTRTATITGKFSTPLTTFTINGDAAGPACDKQTFKLRNIYYYGPYSAGGID